MQEKIIYTLISVLVVSLVSLIGVTALSFTKKKLEEILFLLVSFSAGSLLGGAFFHLIPETVELAGEFSPKIAIQIFAGMGLFFFVDKIIHWNHNHSHDTSIAHTKELKSPRMAYLNLIGDGMHNFLDGLVIAGSYMVNIQTGIATTIAVIIHETPQELADFGVLLYAGMSKKKAILFNFLSACVAFIGAGVGLMLGGKSESFILFALPLTAGAFIYIAGYYLLPLLISPNEKRNKLGWVLTSMTLGLLLMYGLIYLE